MRDSLTPEEIAELRRLSEEVARLPQVTYKDGAVPSHSWANEQHRPSVRLVAAARNASALPAPEEVSRCPRLTEHEGKGAGMNSRFRLAEWDAMTWAAAGMVRQRIQASDPALAVLFMGSAALCLPGANDVDLDVVCASSRISGYARRISRALDVTHTSVDGMAKWEFDLVGVEIDLILSDPQESHVPSQVACFEALVADHHLRAELVDLKRRWDGQLYAEYAAAKAQFFQDRVLGKKA